jgi:hypothetical protein
MMYLLALFCSPLALLLIGKPFQAVLNAILYIAGFLGLAVLFVPGFLCWLLGVVHAFAVISSRNADRRTDVIAQAIVRSRPRYSSPPPRT